MRVLNSDTLEKVAQYNIDYHSLATVQRYVKALQKSDRLELTSTGNILPLHQLDGGARIVVPLIGEIACGEPIFAVENIEESYALCFSKSVVR